MNSLFPLAAIIRTNGWRRRANISPFENLPARFALFNCLLLFRTVHTQRRTPQSPPLSLSSLFSAIIKSPEQAKLSRKVSKLWPNFVGIGERAAAGSLNGRKSLAGSSLPARYKRAHNMPSLGYSILLQTKGSTEEKKKKKKRRTMVGGREV